MRSIYRWEGKIEESTEHQLVMKTSLARVKPLKKRLVELHPYDVPEIVILTGTAARAYADWVDDVTTLVKGPRMRGR